MELWKDADQGCDVIMPAPSSFIAVSTRSHQALNWEVKLGIFMLCNKFILKKIYVTNYSFQSISSSALLPGEVPKELGSVTGAGQKRKKKNKIQSMLS